MTTSSSWLRSATGPATLALGLCMIFLVLRPAFLAKPEVAQVPAATTAAPNTRVVGFDMEQMGRTWWYWFLATQPASDTLTSADVPCHQQHPQVPATLLAGSAGGGSVHRVCSVEKDKPLVFPILTTMSALNLPDSPARVTVGQADKILNDVVPEMKLWIDGVAVTDLAQRRAFGRDCKPLDLQPGSTGPCITFDGYWAVIEPLTPGKHTIEFKARYNSDNHPLGHLAQDVRYDLMVK